MKSRIFSAFCAFALSLSLLPLVRVTPKRTTASSPDIATFEDLSPSSWYYDAVERAVSDGWISADAKLFEPDKPITAAEWHDMLTHALDLDQMENPSTEPINRAAVAVTIGEILESDATFTSVSFKDIEGLSDEEKTAVKACAGLGIMRATKTGLFSPEQPVSRAQAVVILERLLASLG